MDLFSYRRGNLVSFRGIGILPSKSYAAIEAVEEFEEGLRFLFRPRFEGEIEFVGYSDRVHSILLTLSILEQLGFVLNEPSTYVLGAIRLRKFMYYNSSVAGHRTLVLTNYHVIHMNCIDPINLDDLQNNTTPVPRLHVLQNYLEDAGLNQVDFNLLH